jgi:hypothetical protein
MSPEPVEVKKTTRRALTSTDKTKVATPVKKTTRGKAKRVKSPVKTEEGVAQVGKTVVDNVKLVRGGKRKRSVLLSLLLQLL